MTCPLITERIKYIANSLPKGLQPQIFGISVDPAVDTPERLIAFRSSHDLDRRDITLLPSTAEQLSQIIGILRLNLRVTIDPNLHTTRAFLFAPTGTFINSYDLGDPTQVGGLLATIQARISEGSIQ